MNHLSIISFTLSEAATGSHNSFTLSKRQWPPATLPSHFLRQRRAVILDSHFVVVQQLATWRGGAGRGGRGWEPGLKVVVGIIDMPILILQLGLPSGREENREGLQRRGVAGDGHSHFIHNSLTLSETAAASHTSFTLSAAAAGSHTSHFLRQERAAILDSHFGVQQMVTWRGRTGGGGWQPGLKGGTF